MKRKPKILMKFTKDPIPNKINLGVLVYQKMQAAGIYTSPPFTYAQMLILQNALEKSASDVLHGGSVLTYTVQNKAEKDWDTMMRRQAGYVNEIADGDLVKISESGFAATVSEATRWHVPQMLISPVVTFNNKYGGIDIKAEKTKFATAYNFLLVTDPATVKWTGERIKIEPGNTEIFITCSSKKKVHLKNLTKGTRYFVFVYPSGPAGMGGFPDPVPVIFPG